MRAAPVKRWLGLGLCLGLLSGCASRQARSDADAAKAQMLLSEGQYAAARQSIHRALLLRDDVSDYWLLLAHIDVAAEDYPGAYDAYQHVIELDQGNTEALAAVSQLGLGQNDPRKAEQYADQLLLLTPGDPHALAIKGNAQFNLGDKNAALATATGILKSDPTDIGALLLKARILLADGQGPAAAALLEQSLTLGGDVTARLTQLRGVYRQTGNRLAYEKIVDRLAALHPEIVAFQLDHAQSLYDRGQSGLARDAILKIMQTWPDDASISARVLDLWRQQGVMAFPLAAIRDTARGVSPEMQTVFAQYASDLGHPEIALSILSKQDPGEPADLINADSKVAYAGALDRIGDRSRARALLDQVIAYDPGHPRALLTRARLEARAGESRAAIADVRQVIADDPQNAEARMLLADLFLGLNDKVMGLATLREAANTIPSDPRIAQHLAALLVSLGQQADAATVMRDLVHAAPTSLAAWRLRAQLCEKIGDRDCARLSEATMNGGTLPVVNAMPG